MKMSNRLFLLFFLVFLFCFNVSAQKSYPFVLYDSPPQLMTMRQADWTYLSFYRLSSDYIYNNVDDRWSLMLDACLTGFLYVPLTHEEGHRSILTKENIGSISKPYANSSGAAYVVGVTDESLENLRNSKLSTYIRLHTAGLESDFALLAKARRALIFEKDKRITIEYTMRKFAHFTYLFLSNFPKTFPELLEEDDELKRDIVGHDVWGMARHIHRPDMEFHRYTQYDELTSREKSFIERISYFSLLNLVDPSFLYLYSKKDVPNFLITASYSLAPFGDYSEVEFLHEKGFSGYLRFYCNRKMILPAVGLASERILITDKISASAQVHAWMQPEDLDFWEEVDAEAGLGLETFLGYKIGSSEESSLWLDLGFSGKSAGFIPENMFLDEHYDLSVLLTYQKKD